MPRPKRVKGHLDSLIQSFNDMRVEAGMSIDELGELADIHPHNLRRWFNNTTDPSLPRFVQAVTAFGARVRIVPGPRLNKSAGDSDQDTLATSVLDRRLAAVQEVLCGLQGWLESARKPLEDLEPRDRLHVSEGTLRRLERTVETAEIFADTIAEQVAESVDEMNGGD